MSKVTLEHEVLAEVWILTQYPKGKLEFVFGMGRTPQEAYTIAGGVMADPPVSPEQLREMGYKAEKVLLVRTKVEAKRSKKERVDIVADETAEEWRNRPGATEDEPVLIRRPIVGEKPHHGMCQCVKCQSEGTDI